MRHFIVIINNIKLARKNENITFPVRREERKASMPSPLTQIVPFVVFAINFC